MNKKVKKLWVKALRSDEFLQGTDFLDAQGRYCALGVLAVLGLLEGQCTYNQIDRVGCFDQKKRSLSFNILKWADIAQDQERFLHPAEQEVIVTYKGKKTTIAKLNDLGLSFKEIAHIIQKCL